MLIFRRNRSHKWFVVWDVKCGHQNFWYFVEANCIICFGIFGIGIAHLKFTMKCMHTNILLGFFNNTAWDRLFHAFHHLIWTFHVAQTAKWNEYIYRVYGSFLDWTGQESNIHAFSAEYLPKSCWELGWREERMAKESVFYVDLKHWNGSIVNVCVFAVCCVLNIYAINNSLIMACHTPLPKNEHIGSFFSRKKFREKKVYDNSIYVINCFDSNWDFFFFCSMTSFPFLFGNNVL